jgi:hypothetical protein
MAISAKMVVSEILMCGIKKIPVIGDVIDVVDSVRASHEMLLNEERLADLERQMTRFELRQPDLVADEIRTILGALSSPDLGGPELDREIRNFRQIQEQGWDPSLFEGLLRNGPHWKELRRCPRNYGKVHSQGDIPDPRAIRILVEAPGEVGEDGVVEPFHFRRVGIGIGLSDVPASRASMTTPLKSRSQTFRQVEGLSNTSTATTSGPTATARPLAPSTYFSRSRNSARRSLCRS